MSLRQTLYFARLKFRGFFHSFKHKGAAPKLNFKKNPEGPGEPAVVSAEVAKHVQKISLTPEGRFYVAPGSWYLLGFGS